jgi:hypothetical protein
MPGQMHAHYNILYTGSSQQTRWDIIAPLYGISRPHYKDLTWTPQVKQISYVAKILFVVIQSVTVLV